MTMKIMIKGRMWTLDEITRREMNKLSGKETLGLCCPIEREIFVVDSLSKKTKPVIVAHELAHAVIWEYKVPFRSDSQEEMYVSKMDEVMYRVTRIFPRCYKL